MASSVSLRDKLVVVLALTSGATDAVTFIGLGKVFSSVITGNLALLGVAAGQQNASLAADGALALGGYGLGVLVSGVIAGTPEKEQPVWPREVTMALAAELLVLAAFSGGWLAAAGHPAGGGRMALVAVAGAAMGMQATAVRRLGQMSSTYLTSTLTSLLEALVTRRWPEGSLRSTGVLVAFVAGAAGGGSAAALSPSWVPVAILLPLAAVVACTLPRESRQAARQGAQLPLVRRGKKLTERVGELVQLGQVLFGQRGDALVALLGELDPHDPGVPGVRPPPDEPRGLRAVHETHGAVTLQHQVLGTLADGRRLRARVPLDRYK